MSGNTESDSERRDQYPADVLARASAHLDEAQSALEAAAALEAALASIRTLLDGATAEPSKTGFSSEPVRAEGMDAWEAAQFSRLTAVRNRAAARDEVEAADANQAIELARRMLERFQLSPGQTGRSPLPAQVRPAAHPPLRAQTGEVPTPLPLSPAPSLPYQAPAATSMAGTGNRVWDVGRSGGQHGGMRWKLPKRWSAWLRSRPAARPLSALERMAWLAVDAALALLSLALGPLVLSLLGPPWIRWLAWLPAAGLVWRGSGHLLRLGERSLGTAVSAALGIGLILGLVWAAAAGAGWMPPPQYALRAPLPLMTADRTETPAGLKVGTRARVGGTGGNGLRVHAEPSVNAPVVSRLPDGSSVRVLAGPQAGDGFTWWRVQGEQSTGWVVDEWLTPSN